jgi:uncharacterized membrane protein
LASPDGGDALGATAARRMWLTFGCGVVAFAVAMALTPWQAAALVGWDVSSALLVTWVWLVIGNRDAAATARLARREDNSRAAADLTLMAAAVASLVGVGFLLLKASGEGGGPEAVLTALAVVSVMLSWLTVQAVFTLHYARVFYEEPTGGIDFNEDGEPDYRDFAYVAFTLGMTYQVSDTTLTSGKMRRLVLRHAVLSYLFGTIIVALTINVVAGLLRP